MTPDRLGSPKDVAFEHRVSLFSYKPDSFFKPREGAYRRIGFEGANALREVKRSEDFWEGSISDTQRVLFAVAMSLQLPREDAEKFRHEANLWEKTSNARAKIVFTAVMSFLNTSLRIGHYDLEWFYNPLSVLSMGDSVLKPLKRDQNPIVQKESDDELQRKLEKARTLCQNDPTQIVMWEDEGLDCLPKEITDYLIGIIPVIRNGAIPDYAQYLGKEGITKKGERKWHKPMDPNVKDMRFLMQKPREEIRTVIRIDTGTSDLHKTRDPRHAFLAKVYEPSIYDKDFSYTRAMRYWDKVFEEVSREKGVKLEDSKIHYDSRWGWVFFSNRIKDAEFNEEKARALLEADYPGASELLEQAAIALRGKMDPDKFDPEREIIGLRILEKGHIIFRDPVFPRASRIEAENAREAQRKRREQTKKDEFKDNQEALSMNAGKEKLILSHYIDMVRKWMGEFINVAGASSPLFREYGDLHQRNLKLWGVYENLYARKKRAGRSLRNKMYASEYRDKLDKKDSLSIGELYQLAINALRNPRAGEISESELVGFDLLKACFEKAGSDLSVSLNKAFFARVLMEENIRKWVKNRPKRQTEPKIRSIVFTIMRSMTYGKQISEYTAPTLKFSDPEAPITDLDQIP